MIVCVFVGVQRHIKQYFSYTVATNFIDGGNRIYPEKYKPAACH